MTARTMLLTDEEMIRESYGRHMVRHLYEAERNRLLDEIERMKAMVPRWVPVAQKIALDIQGWLPLEDQKCGDDERLWLMVPPIPLPEKHEEKGSDHE